MKLLLNSEDFAVDGGALPAITAGYITHPQELKRILMAEVRRSG